MFWGVASAGADEPPLKKPPTAWPMEDPTATPLEAVREECLEVFVLAFKWRLEAPIYKVLDLRGGRCHLSEQTGSLRCRSLSLLLHWGCLLRGRSGSGCRALLGSSCGLRGGHGRPAGSGSSTLTRHFDG